MTAADSQGSPATIKTSFQHQTVLRDELVTGLNILPGGHYLDATVGGGGHSEELLQARIPLHLTIIDQDHQAIAAAITRLHPL